MLAGRQGAGCACGAKSAEKASHHERTHGLGKTTLARVKLGWSRAPLSSPPPFVISPLLSSCRQSHADRPRAVRRQTPGLFANKSSIVPMLLSVRQRVRANLEVMRTRVPSARREGGSKARKWEWGPFHCRCKIR
eukprot:1391516-Rhodomonas_salina.2